MTALKQKTLRKPKKRWETGENFEMKTINTQKSRRKRYAVLLNYKQHDIRTDSTDAFPIINLQFAKGTN